MRRLLIGIAIGLVINAVAARAETIQVTGYSTPSDWTTADRTPLGPGIAACPAWMRFGTVLEIDGVGLVTCHDRTPGNPQLIDVWFDRVADCFAVTGIRTYTYAADTDG